jgi:subtilisin family serine protease
MKNLVLKNLILIPFLVFIVSENSFSALHVPGEIVFQIKKSKNIKIEKSTIESVLVRTLGEGSVLKIDSLKTDEQVGVLKLALDTDLERALLILKDEPNIEIAEPNFIVRAVDGDPKEGIPNDLDFGKLWGLSNTGQKGERDSDYQVGTVGVDLHVLPVWKQGFYGSRDILVAVIDSGIDLSHPDLVQNIYTNPGESGDKANNGIDDDGNGFIDDVHGWNFVAKNNNPTDDMGHGSHCSGTIGGVGNNNIGIAGVNWKVSILPIKFLTATGSGNIADAVEAINYARKMKARVMNNSWGSPAAGSEILKKAIQAASDSGILFVAAAGNDGLNNDVEMFYPATYPIKNIISVAASSNQGKLAYFSNYGPKTVHVVAPGMGIYSTSKNGQYAFLSGTSMATPHVAGLAALLLSIYPQWTGSELKDQIIRTSKRTHLLAPSVIAKGSVDAFNAVNGIFQTPEPRESEWVTKPMHLETEHPYANNTDLKFEVKVPGAKKIRLHFTKIALERNYDRVLLQQKDGEEIADITGEFLNYTTEYAIGDTINIFLDVDKSLQDYGFQMDSVQYIP